MSWGNPAALWFLSAIPLVVLLYFLRLKRREVVVSSTLLWSRVLEDKRVNSPFQRFRRSLLLVLQILTLLLLAGALGRPEVESKVDFERTHIILIDVSASMSVVENGRTRLERAQALAREYVDGIADNARAVVIRFARRAKAVTPITSDRRVLHSAIDALTIVAGPTAIDEALALAISVARSLSSKAQGTSGENDASDAIAIIYSDGGFADWEEEQIPLPLQFVSIGAPAANSGIVALAARLDYSAGARTQVYVEVRNAGTAPVSGILAVSQDGVDIRAAEPAAPIAPQERWSHSFEADVEGLVEVTWNPDGGGENFRLDDCAWLEIEPRRATRIWRIGSANYFLDEALRALPLVEHEAVLMEEAPARLGAGAPAPAVLIWDRTAPEELPDIAGQLFIGELPPGIWNAKRIKEPPIISWDRAHPVNRFLSYANLEVAESHLLESAPGTSPLLETSGGALISSFARPGVRGLVVGFDLLRSNWPLDLSFPLFLHNAIGFLAGTNVGPTAGVRAEELISVRGHRGNREFAITRPDGTTVSQPADREGWLRYAETESLGPYRIAWQEPGESGARAVECRVPVNLLSARESDLTPRAELKIGGQRVAGDSSQAITRKDYWPWLLLSALLFLLGEWYCFHRR